MPFDQNYLGLGLLQEALQPYINDYGNSKNLANAYWVFHLNHKYSDYRVSGSLKVSVSAYSGAITSLSYTPLILPKTLEVRIDKDDALDAVLRFSESIWDGDCKYKS